MITIALTKGRILLETLPLLSKAGIEPAEDIQSSRKLVFATNLSHVQLIVLRGSDVPTYVNRGAADMGIAGKDTLMEFGDADFYEMADLNIARCRLMTAAPKARQNTPGSHSKNRIRVATKFVNVAKTFYAAKGQQAEVVKLYGAMELAPIMNLADEIVDIVDTGKTLEANGLEAIDTIATVSSRLIVNSAAMVTKHSLILPIAAQIESAVTDQN